MRRGVYIIIIQLVIFPWTKGGIASLIEFSLSQQLKEEYRSAIVAYL